MLLTKSNTNCIKYKCLRESITETVIITWQEELLKMINHRNINIGETI